MRNTKIYANRNHALAAREQAAKSGPGAGFGFEALAVRDFFEDVWVIWGDERKLVSPCERSLLVWKLLGEQQVLERTLGTMRLLEGFLEQAAGVFDVDTASLSATDTTSETLKNAVEMLVVSYYRTLEDRGLIEAGEAAKALCGVMPAMEVTLGEYVAVLPAQRLLLDQWGVDTSLLDEAAQLEALDEGVVPSFLMPAGATAVYDLMKDEIEAYVAKISQEGVAQSTLGNEAQQRVAVLVKRPREAFNALAPRLCGRGIACSVEESVAFLGTWIGKACNAVWQLLSGDSHWLVAATDFAYNPLSGMPSFAAEALNVTYRADRRLIRADVQQALADQSTYELFAKLLGGDNGSEDALSGRSEGFSDMSTSWPEEISDQSLVETLRERIVQGIAYDERDRELAMLDELVKTLKLAQAFALRPRDIFEMLLDLKVVSAQEAGLSEKSCGHVAFVPLSAALKLPYKSQGLVILGDVSTEAFNLSTEHSSLEVFAAQLGIDLLSDPLQDAFRLFGAAQRAAIRQFTCVQSLHNEAMEEAFPSCIYDEYRALLSRHKEPIGEIAALDVGEKRRGEECLNTGLGKMFASLDRVELYETAARGMLTYAPLLQYLPRVEEGAAVLPILSASAIEAYLNCPYQWFITYGLGVSSFDEAYDARAQGTFVHQVLAAFYGRIKAQGLELSGELLQKDALFDQIFDEVREAQWERSYDRLIALTETEKQDVELLRETLRRSLMLQVDLPKNYEPMCFEYRISPDDGIDYAGARLRGSVDRVDVDLQSGDFVVLDYKSSSVGHAAPYDASGEEEAFSLPAYVQALIYAQAVRRKGLELDIISGKTGPEAIAETATADKCEQVVDDTCCAADLQCAGALYVGYKARSQQNLLAGSYDQSRYKVSDFVAKDSQVKGEFSHYLDTVEQTIAPYVQALTAGEIAGNVRTGGSCRYCALAGRGQCLAAAQAVEALDADDGLPRGSELNSGKASGTGSVHSALGIFAREVE